jgi:hypothetical protein
MQAAHRMGVLGIAVIILHKGNLSPNRLTEGIMPPAFGKPAAVIGEFSQYNFMHIGNV